MGREGCLRAGAPDALDSHVSAQAPSAVILIRAERFIPNPATAADNAFQRDVPEGQSDDATSTKAAGRDGRRRPGPPGRRRDGSTSSRTRTTPARTASSRTTGCPPTRAATSRSTRCMPPTVATSVAPTCWSCSSPSTGSRPSWTTPASNPTASSSRAPARWCSTTCRGSPTRRAATGPTPTSSSGSAPTSATSRWPSTRSTPTGVPVYHTNVIACIGTDVAMIALEMIPDEQRREQVRERLSVNGRMVVELTEQQIREFAGNAVELCGRTPEGRRRYIMAMSARARAQPAPGPGRGDRGVLRDRRRRHPHDRARRRVGAVHDRRCPPRPAPAVEPEPTAAVEAIDENPHTADGQDVAMGDIAD